MRIKLQRWMTLGMVACLPLLMAGGCDDDEVSGITAIIRGVIDLVLGIIELTD